jgi:hypothetical protein
MAALKLSKVSNKINTAFVERQNGTDRGRNGPYVNKVPTPNGCRRLPPWPPV